MSVQLYTALGYTKCKWCNHPLVLNSTTDYNKCENCGGLYKEDNPLVFKPVYNWHYRLWQLRNLFSLNYPKQTIKL